MAGRQASSVVTRYAGIQVQTSSLGVQIPVGWATHRCNCNLVDYLDFKSTAQKAATGKGGGSTVTGYSYSATIILAIEEGAIDAVTQVWVDGKTYAFSSNGSGVANTGSTAAYTQVGLSLNLGAIGQAVWSYLTSAHPDHAIGYSGLAIAYAENYALDSGASTPNHSFEVVKLSGFAVGGGYTGPDADPSLVVTDFFQNTRTGVPSWGTGLLDPVTMAQYQAYALAAGLLVSPVIDQERSASDFLTEMLLATNSNVVWSEGLLKFIPYGDTALTGNGKTFTPNLTPVYLLNDDSYIVEKDSDAPLLVDIQDQSDAYNVVQLEYLDRTNQYNMAIALASDAANVAQYGMRRQDPTTIHCVCTPAVANLSATLYLQRTLYIRGQYKFALAWAFALLEPGDIVELTDVGLGLSAYPVRITEIDEDEKSVLSLTCEDLLVGVSNAPLYTMEISRGVSVNQGLDPGGVEANLLLWSADFTNAVWPHSALTVTAAATTNPVTGATDAQLLVPTTSNSSHAATQNGIAVFPGANYTYSCYVKSAGYNFAYLRIGNSGGTNPVNVVVDLTLGTVALSSTGGTAVLVGTPTVASVGSGWFRVAFTFQTGDSTIGFGVRPAATATTAAFAGNGTSGIYAWGANVTQGVDIRPFTLTTTAISGPLLFNPPTALTSGGVATWAAVAGGPNWGGANVWASFDGTNYELVGATPQGSSRFGSLTAGFASHADPDTADTLSVDLSASAGILTSAAQAVADASGTLCLIDSELIAFETATLTNPNRYNLVSYIRRGVLNTAIAAHGAGAAFIRLDSSIFDFPYLATQGGKSVSVKFQSFNLFGGGVTPLSNCNAYTIVPAPAPGAGPASSAWTVSPTTISGGGVNIPALLITGHSDNLSATAVAFFYRPTGTTAWISAGQHPISTTSYLITSIVSGTTYDVGVAYLVGGVLTPIQLASGSGSGSTGGGGSGGAVGTAIVNTSVTGAGSFTVPAGPAYAHVDIILTGYAGAGNGTNTGGKGGVTTDRGGGGGMVCVVKGFPVTAGFAFSWNLGGAAANSTCTGTALTLTAKPGADATTTASGAGATTSGVTNTATGSTSVTNYAGHNGGLTDTWDGGGPGATIVVTSGTVTNPGPDNTTLNSAGSIPGQGGSGDAFVINAGGGANILIIART